MGQRIITKEIAIRAVLFGACKIPPVGARISEFSTSDLIWAEKILTQEEKKKMTLPLWVQSENGDGYG